MATLKKLLLVSVPGLTFAVVLLELLLRIFGYRLYYLEKEAFVPSADSKILYEWRPGYKGLYAGVLIAINSLGFRGPEPAAGEEPRGFRIAVLGDSVAFGQGLPEGQTLAEQLEARLRGKLGGPVKAFNLGVPGYDTCQEDWLFKERQISLHPQVAVLLYIENDTDPPVFRIVDGKVISPDVRTGWFGDWMAALRKHSAAYNLAWTRWQLLKAHRSSTEEHRAILARKFNESNPGWQASRACLANMSAVMRNHSIRLIVIPFPPMDGIQVRPFPFPGYIQTVCDAARASGAECLDVTPDIQSVRAEIRVSVVDQHPSAKVYAKVAEAIERTLER